MESETSKKPKILLAGIILLVFLAVSSGFLVKKLTPVLEKSVVKSTVNDMEQSY